MRIYLFTLFLLLAIFFFGSNMLFAQNESSCIPSDSFRITGEKCSYFFNNNQWDSTIYYTKLFKEKAKNEFGEMSFHYSSVLYMLAEIYRTINNYNEAYFYYKSCNDHFEKISVDTSVTYRGTYVASLFRMGIVAINMGAISEAEVYLFKAAQLNKKYGMIPEFAQCMLNIANIYASKGEYTKAELMDINVQAMLDTSLKSPNNYYIIASCNNNMGLINGYLGDLQKSIFYMKKGVSYMQKARDLENALETFVDDDLITVKLNLADIYTVTGFADSANMLCRQVEDSLLLKKNDLLYALLLKEKATICQRQNNLKGAIQLYLTFKSISDTLAIKPDEYEATLINLGSLYTKIKAFHSADSLLREEDKKLLQSGLVYSYEEQQAILALCANLIDEKKYSEAIDSLTALCHLTFTAMDKNFYGMSENEKLKYKNGLDEIFNLLYITLYNLKAVNKNKLSEIYKLELQRNNFVLLGQANLFSRLRNSKDSVLSGLYKIWLNNKEILSRQYSLPADQRIFNTDSLENICETLEKKVSEKDNSIIAHEYHSTLSNGLLNQQSVSANIQFVRFNYKTDNDADSALYAAFINRNGDSALTFVHLCSEKIMLKMMQDKAGGWIDGNQLAQKLYNSQSAGAARFYNLIWKPLVPYLKGIKNINYAASGLINNISLQALFDGKNYLTYKYTFHRFFSLGNNEKHLIGYQKPQSISIWGNIDYDNAVYGLSPSQENEQKPAAYFSTIMTGIKTNAQTKNISGSAFQPFDTVEIAQLKKIFSDHHIPISSYQNGYATEENFKENASLIKDVLHISTHGFYTPLDKTKSNGLLPGNFISGTVNPLFRCGLAFSGVNYYWLKGVAKQNHEDGILTGYEVGQLDLRNVQLLTLSACETGLGDVTGNEGNLGLQRAFKLAGVHNMLVSLWQVPAKQTAGLLSLFYTNWLNGKTLSEALQNAQKQMQKKNYPPYFWAGFVLIE